MVLKARIARGITNHHRPLFDELIRVRKKGECARGLTRTAVRFGFQPLALLFDQRDKGNGRLEQTRRHSDNAIERRLGICVDDVEQVKRFQPLALIFADRVDRMTIAARNIYSRLGTDSRI